MISRARIEQSKRELLAKSEQQIEYETAVTWGARAIAAYELGMQTGRSTWIYFAEHLYHEALEHAALASEPAFATEIRRAVESTRRAALAEF